MNYTTTAVMPKRRESPGWSGVLAASVQAFPPPHAAFELSPVLGQSFCVARSRGTHFVVTANTLIEGAAVYLCADGSWASRLADAWAIEREPEVDAALAVARTQERHVCDPYAFKVVLGAQGPTATNTREQIRGVGPTIPLRRLDSVPTRLSA
jgi:hypothetical protein